MNASLNKWILLPSIVSLMALALSGCEEEDVFFGVGSSNNITLTRFADSYDSKANATAIARIDETYRTGDYEIKTRNLVNNYSNQSLNTLDKTVLADKFEGRLEHKNIEVSGRTFKRPIYEKNSNNNFNYQTTYKTLDLSDVKGARKWGKVEVIGNDRTKKNSARWIADSCKTITYVIWTHIAPTIRRIIS